MCTNFSNTADPPQVDPKGYILYCPCMGRFGNQADQFLGSLGFARLLDRTLVLPAWVEYRSYKIESVQVPFDTYFKVEPLKEYHRVMTMESFMEELAPTIWPPGNRTVVCYGPRSSSNKADKPGCHAKEGNPFKSFWDTYSVDFDESSYYSPLHYGTSKSDVREWNEKYPPDDFPVLAFTGPPAAFPVSEHQVKLQKYVKWSDKYATAAEDFISENIPERPFLGIHLRNGEDFKNACEHIKTSPSLFAAAQCIGYRSQFGTTTYEMCYPDTASVVKQVKAEVKRIKAKTVFIATDHMDLISDFSAKMKKVKFVRQPMPADPMLDLAILAQADHFIGNCISSFTAFVKRERDTAQRSSSFWNFTPMPLKTPKQENEEL